ncbi:flavodoxin [Halonatronum saccharophilum]|uniref:flavodoxin n=1 Tax=Halonatronum saccharophilum TaxID=150060 RepID=UPI0004885A6F|nr:flavodoxin [Halonatronum saccharophilum]
MSKTIVIYGSTMGNTETLAIETGEVLKDRYNIVIKDVKEVSPEELEGFDLIVFGSSTWGAGELQDDFYDFYNKLEGIDLSGKKGAAFGPGDKAYGEFFCQAVDMLEEKLEELGAQIVVDGFKWDGDIDGEAKDKVREWANKL